MIECSQLRDYIIKPSLQLINMYSEGSEELLVAICAQESSGGRYLKQIGGPALGIFQMQPSTHDNIWTKYLLNSDKEKTINTLGYTVLKGCRYIISPPAEVMIHNLYYATMMARCFWLGFEGLIPDKNDLDGIWDIYKEYWNTEDGAAIQSKFFSSYYEFTSS